MNSFNVKYEKLIKKGFTMAENLVVLAVIGVILAMVVPGLINDKNTALSRCMALAYLRTLYLIQYIKQLLVLTYFNKNIKHTYSLFK